MKTFVTICLFFLGLNSLNSQTYEKWCYPISNGTGYVNYSGVGYSDHYGDINVGKSTLGIQNRGFAIFNLSGIPTNAIIEDIAISVYVEEGFSSISSNLEFRRLLGALHYDYDYYSWSTDGDLYNDIGGWRYGYTDNTYDNYTIPLTRCYFDSEAIKVMENQLTHNYFRFGVGFYTPSYSTDRTTLSGGSYNPVLYVKYSLPTPPEPATNPNPSDYATNVLRTVDPSWSNGGGATSYDIYFGTDATPDAGEYQGNTSSTSYNPGTLTYNTTYYWRIDAVN